MAHCLLSVFKSFLIFFCLDPLGPVLASFLHSGAINWLRIGRPCGAGALETVFEDEVLGLLFWLFVPMARVIYRVGVIDFDVI